MNCFIDASIILAILGRENDWQEQSDRFDEQDARLWSPMTQWESVAGLRLRLKRPAEEARRLVTLFAGENEMALVPIGRHESDVALDAYQHYGKGGSHPAQLNMGDCFVCACARTNHARLLYKGNDFSHTDMAL